jgi:hypothetical protein
MPELFSRPGWTRPTRERTTMQIVVVPFQLKDGVSEQQMLALSEEFDAKFVTNQPGIIKRIVGKGPAGGYADIVFFKDAAAIGAVMEAEDDSAECAALFATAVSGEPLMFEALQIHESAHE